MKSWFLMLGVFSCSLLPLSLVAEDSSDSDAVAEDVIAEDAEQERDFAPLLGDRGFVDNSHHFFRRLSRNIERRSSRMIRRSARYSDAPFAVYWTKKIYEDQNFLDNEDHTAILSFVGLGVYAHEDFLDQEKISEFKKLQDQLFKSYIQYTYSESWDGIEQMEENLMVELKEFCTQSKDPFFSEKVIAFLGDAATRMEALLNALPSFNTIDIPDFSDNSDRKLVRIAAQFEALQNFTADDLKKSVKEQYSLDKMTLLLENLNEQDEDSLDELG